MGDPLELFIMIKPQLSINYLLWTNLSAFRDFYKALHDISGNILEELFVRRENTMSLGSKPELFCSER